VRVVLAVAIASALGGLSRYGLGGAIARRNSNALPWETLLVNVSGAFALGLLFVISTERYAVAPWLRAAVLVGFLGSYTTFSTWTLESWRLLEDGAYGVAFANLLGSMAAGVAATYAGIVLGRVIS
jgi:CrcB protein